MEEIQWQDQPGRDGYFVTRGDQPDTYTIIRRCPFCNGLALVTVPGPGLWAWEHGDFVQRAFPDLSPEDREMVMTGTHPECWDEFIPKEPDIKYPDVHVQLSGGDGNAFAIMGAVTKALRRHGVPEEEIIKYREESMSGNYDHLLQTAMEWVDVS